MHAKSIHSVVTIIFFDHLLPFLRQKSQFRILHGGHLGKWRPYWNFAWPAFFSWIVTPIEYLCQICCLYHNLNDSYSYLLRYIRYQHFTNCSLTKLVSHLYSTRRDARITAGQVWSLSILYKNITFVTLNPYFCHKNQSRFTKMTRAT